MNKNNGFSQVLVIVGSVLMLLGLLAVSTLVTKNQDNRNKATYSCSETTRPTISCTKLGKTYPWTCGANGLWECIATAPTTTNLGTYCCDANDSNCNYFANCPVGFYAKTTSTPYQTATPFQTPTPIVQECCCDSDGANCKLGGALFRCKTVGKVSSPMSYCSSPTGGTNRFYCIVGVLTCEGNTLKKCSTDGKGGLYNAFVQTCTYGCYGTSRCATAPTAIPTPTVVDPNVCKCYNGTYVGSFCSLAGTSCLDLTSTPNPNNCYQKGCQPGMVCIYIGGGNSECRLAH